MTEVREEEIVIEIKPPEEEELVEFEVENEEKAESLVVDDNLYDFVDLDQGIDEERIKKDLDLDRAAIKQITTGRGASSRIKIILFLYNYLGDYHVDDLARRVGLSRDTCIYQLDRLVEYGIVERVPKEKLFNKHLRVYRLIDCIAVDKIVRRIYRLASFKLAKLIPSEGIRINDLLSKQKFVEMCSKYYILPSEGIELLKSNKYKVTVEGNKLKYRDLLPTVPLEESEPKPHITVEEVLVELLEEE